MLEQPIDRVIHTAVEEFAENTLTDLYPEIPLEDFLQMAETHPLVGACLDVYALIAKTYVGSFSHQDETIKAFINSNFSTAKTDMKEVVSAMMIFVFIGYSYAEFNHEDINAQWRLTSLDPLDPRKYHFAGQGGKTTAVVLDDKDKDVIPYEKGVHVTNAKYLAFGSPYGHAVAKRMHALWKAWRIIMNEVILGGQRQAAPTLAGYAEDEDVTLYNKDGKPLKENNQEVRRPGVFVMAQALKNLRNNGDVIATKSGNKIESIDNTVSGEFFKTVLEYLGLMMFFGMLMPETALLTGKGGLGNSGINQGHLDMLSLLIESAVGTITAAIQESVIKPLIAWNFGEQDDYGSLQKPNTGIRDRDKILSAAAKMVEKAVAGLSDIDVVNKIRELLGVRQLTKQEFEAAKKEARELAQGINGTGADGGDSEDGDEDED